jgi:hypothetical protein
VVIRKQGTLWFAIANFSVPYTVLSNGATVGLIERVYSDGMRQKIFSTSVSAAITTASGNEYFGSVTVNIPAGTKAFSALRFVPGMTYRTTSTGLIKPMINDYSPTSITVLLISSAAIDNVTGVLTFDCWGT